MEFKAVVQRHEGLDAGYIVPPFDVEKVFGAKRVKVKATFNGVPYRGSIVHMGGCYWLGVTQEIRKAAGINFGDEIAVSLEKDSEERAVEVPAELKAAFAAAPDAEAFYNTLSFTARKEYAAFVGGAKQPATRLARAEKAVLLLGDKQKLR